MDLRTRLNSPQDLHLSRPHLVNTFNPHFENERKQIMANNEIIIARRLKEMKENEEIKMVDGKWVKTDKFKEGPSFITAVELP